MTDRKQKATRTFMVSMSPLVEVVNTILFLMVAVSGHHLIKMDLSVGRLSTAVSNSKLNRIHRGWAFDLSSPESGGVVRGSEVFEIERSQRTSE